MYQRQHYKIMYSLFCMKLLIEKILIYRTYVPKNYQKHQNFRYIGIYGTV